MNPHVKQGLRSLLSWGLIVFLLPQLFLLCYYFPVLIRKQGNWLVFAGEIAKYGLTISWVSLPFLTVVYAGVRAAFTLRLHGMAIWAISKIAGKSPQWSLATGVSIFCLCLLLSAVFLIAVPRFKKIQALTDAFNDRMRENLMGLRVVRAFNAEKFQIKFSFEEN